MIRKICILIGIAVVTAFTVNFFAPWGIPLIGQWDETMGVTTASAIDDVVGDNFEIDHVTIAKLIYDRQEAVFVDARSDDLFSEGHIKGAVSMPLNQFDSLIDGFLEIYQTDMILITYCSGRSCEDSHHLAQLLFEYGYTTVFVFIDGYPAWEAQGYPVE